MADWLNIRRRHARATPMRARRMQLVPAAAGGAPIPTEDAPELVLAEPQGAKSRLLTGGISALIHGGLIAGLLLAAWLAPIEEEEALIEVQMIRDEVRSEESAPAPRVIAEARAAYDPAPMALAPQVVNPAVIQKAAPVVAARKLDMETLATVQAPKVVERAARTVNRAQAYQSQFKVTADPVQIDANAPAIRGPVEIQAPSGIQAGPRQIASRTGTVGIADPKALGTGSAVREGIASNRDVLGAKTGVRADVNWAVGNSNLRGTGGSGTGPGGITWDQCHARPEVRAYMERIKRRMYARWALPPEIPANQQVELRFVLDPAGTASRVELVAAQDGRLGRSAVEALRSASPFDHMSDRVRCLAGHPLIGTFRNPVATN